MVSYSTRLSRTQRFSSTVLYRAAVSPGVIAVLVVLLLLIPADSADAQWRLDAEPQHEGGWWPSIDAADLEGGAGSDYEGTMESAREQTLLHVRGTEGQVWRLEVRRFGDLGRALPEAVELDIRVTSLGNGDGEVTVVAGDGGLNRRGESEYVPVSENYSGLLRGRGERSDIALQMRVRGVSVATVA